MKKIIILLLCCGVLVGMVGCGGNTAPPSTESPQTTVSETTITEVPTETIPPTTTVKPTEKEKGPVPTESKEQATETTKTATEHTTMATPTKETKTTVTSIAEENVAPLIEEVPPITTPQLTERETTAAEPPKEEPRAEMEAPNVTEPEPTEKPAPFNIDHRIAYARNYAESKGLVLSSTAVDCWDTPIRAGAHCIYLERDIQSRLDRYANDEDITDVWIWQKQQATIATTFISATLKNRILLSIKIPTGCGSSILNLATTSGGYFFILAL